MSTESPKMTLEEIIESGNAANRNPFADGNPPTIHDARIGFALRCLAQHVAALERRQPLSTGAADSPAVLCDRPHGEDAETVIDKPPALSRNPDTGVISIAPELIEAGRKLTEQMRAEAQQTAPAPQQQTRGMEVARFAFQIAFGTLQMDRAGAPNILICYRDGIIGDNEVLLREMRASLASIIDAERADAYAAGRREGIESAAKVAEDKSCLYAAAVIRRIKEVTP